jgi:hypothetical protein
VIGAAYFVHRINQHGYMLGLNVLMNAVTQVEDMAVAAAKGGQDLGDLLAYTLG